MFTLSLLDFLMCISSYHLTNLSLLFTRLALYTYNQILVPLMQESISSVEQVLAFFRKTQRHLFYIGPIYGTTLLDINDHYPNFQMITCNDPYFGAHPFITVPASFKHTHKECIVGSYCGNNILKDPEVIAYMKAKDPHPNVLLMLVDDQTEELCKQNGLNVWGATAELFNYLGNKVKIIELLTKAGIPFIPNVSSSIKSYQHLLELTSSFKTDKICIQAQDGCGGWGTFFIFNEEDYNRQHTALEDGRQYKIMPYKRLKGFAIGAVATKAGTIIGPIQSELIGHEQLTPFRGGYCGNEIRRDYFEDPTVEKRVRREIAEYCIKFSEFLYREGLFRGIFGYDFTVDMDTNEVYFMEMNPRLTGSTSLAFQVYQAQGHRFPIFLYHCLEFLGIEIKMDIAALNEEWIGLEHYQQEYSFIVLRPLVPQQTNIPYSFPGGFWREEGGELKYTGNTNFRLNDMKEGEIFFKPNRGFSKGNILLRRRCQDYNFKLTEETRQLIDKFIAIRGKDAK